MHRITTARRARRARRVTSALVCAGLALGMTGCAEDPQPSLPPAAAPEESSTASAQATGTGDVTPSAGVSSGGGASPTGEAIPSGSPSLSGEFERDADGYPLMPAAAKENTKAGAEAFARWYLSLVSALTVNPQPGVLAAHSLPTCKTCANNESTNQERASNGKHLAQEAWSLQPTKFVAPGTAGEGWIVQVPVVQAPVDFIDSHGDKIREIDSVSYVLYVSTVYGRDGWKVSKLQLQDQPT